MTSAKVGAVMYCDGSCGPTNPGNYGWGAHGYFYESKEIKKNVTVENYIITNKGYVESKFLEDRLPIEPTKYIDMLGSSLEIGTNNKAEVLALYNTLLLVDQHNIGTLHVLTDSEYTRNGITEWCKNWERYNWVKHDGSSIVNSYEWRLTYHLLLDLKAKGLKFTIEWVKAHNNVLGNTQADILSVIGRNYSTARTNTHEKNISEAKGYWKTEIEKHPFINFKRIYFNSVSKYNMSGQYFQADPGGSDFTIGKRIPETGFAIVKLKEPDYVIESIKKKQFEISAEINAIVMMKLDRVYSKEIYPYIKNHGGHCLLDGKGNLNLNFIDKKPITVEMNPTGLSMRAIETFNYLEEILDDFLKLKEEGSQDVSKIRFLNAHDVTSSFYDIEEKLIKKELVVKHILKKEFVVGFKDFTLEVDEEFEGRVLKVKVPLILGTDLLPRNNLKRLETENPKVYLITWRESIKTIRYATIIECSTGIGIWSNYFADKIFLNNHST